MFADFPKLSLQDFIATHAVHKDRVVFMQPPGVGGTSLQKALKRVAPGLVDLDTTAPDQSDTKSFLTQTPIESVTGSFEGQKTPKLIGFVAHPVDRVLNQLNLLYGETWDTPETQEKAVAFVEDPANRDLCRRWLVGPDVQDLHEVRQSIEQKFCYVGTVATFPLSINIAGRLCGRNVLPLSAEMGADHVLLPSQALVQLIILNNVHDLSLFEYVRDLQSFRRDDWRAMQKTKARVQNKAKVAPSAASKAATGAAFLKSLPKAPSLEAAIDIVFEAITRVNASPKPAQILRSKLAELQQENLAAAAQHLRNLLLAYSDGRLFRKMEKIPGLRGKTRIELGALATYLDHYMGQNLKTSITLPPLQEGSAPKRILIVLDYLPGNDWMGAHARQMCSYAAALAGLDSVEAVRVLVTQETAPENPFMSNGEVGETQAIGWRSTLNDMAGPAAEKVEFITPPRDGLIRSHQTALQLAQEFAPDAMLAFQGMYRSRLVAPVLGEYLPCVAIQFNQYNPEPPFADLILAHSFRPEFIDKPRPERWRNHPIPLVPFPKHSEISTDTLYPDADLRIITALSQGRLEKGLLANDAADLKRVVRFLKTYPNVAWILAGMMDVDGLITQALEACPEMRDVMDRMICLPAVSDLRAIYSHCAIYAHLPILHGGAMGVAMAIDEGLPALVRGGTDSANFIDQDLIYHDGDTAFFRLGLMIEDPIFRSRVHRRQQERLKAKHAIPATGQVLRTFLNDAASLRILNPKAS